MINWLWETFFLSTALLVGILAVRGRALDLISRHVSQELLEELLWVSNRARRMGIHLVAGKGSGKSRMMGRLIAWLDFIQGIPQLILDPVGGTIDNFLDKMLRLPQEAQEQLWPWVTYVDMSGRGGRVVPMPLYYRLGNESLAEVAGRFVQAVRRIDPHLVTASVEGWSALWRTGTYTGMVLAALGCQITEAPDLLHRPEAWERRMRDALAQNPQLRPAVNFFLREYKELHPSGRRRLAGTFENRISLFTLDPYMRAMFGAAEPGINWGQVERRRQTVLMDFRHEHDVERRRFKMLWAFLNFLEYVKWRGPGRHEPIGLIIDELTALTNLEALGQSVFASDMDELINVIARNYGVWLTIAHQEMWQVDERLQNTLMTMGTQVIGSTTNMGSALALGQHFFPVDPHRVKHFEKVLMVPPMTWPPVVVDVKPVEYSVEEQIYMSAYEVKNQHGFNFLVRPAPREGDVTGEMIPITIENIDPGQWPDDAWLTKLRKQLIECDGRKVEDVLGEIRARLEPGAAVRRRLQTDDQEASQPPTRPSIPASDVIDLP